MRKLTIEYSEITNKPEKNIQKVITKYHSEKEELYQTVGRNLGSEDKAEVTEEEV